MPPEKAAAAPSPCNARKMSNQTMSLASANPAENSAKLPTPVRKMRRRPKLSASAPAAIRQLPKVSMKALVTQLRAIGLPPSVRLIAGKATAGPVKVRGIAAAAQQTATSTKNFSVGLATFV